jgi:hypothetical protein
MTILKPEIGFGTKKGIFSIKHYGSRKVKKQVRRRKLRKKIFNLEDLFNNTYFKGLFYEGPSHHSLKTFCATPMNMTRMSSFLPIFYN